MSQFSKSLSELFLVVVRQIVYDNVLLVFVELECLRHVRVVVKLVFVNFEVALVPELVWVQLQQGKGFISDCGICLLIVYSRNDVVFEHLLYS